MNGSHVVREATLADVPAVARIHVDAWRETYGGLISEAAASAFSYADREALWTKALAPGSTTSFYVAEFDGAVAGFAAGGPARSAEPHYDAELYCIYLDGRRKRRGLGRALFEAVRGRLRERGFKAMLLWVLDGNDAAAFYERLGLTRFSTGTFELAGETLVEHGYGFEL